MNNDVIYKPIGENDAEICQLVGDGKMARWFADLINGTSRSATWTPIEVELDREDEGRPLHAVDAPAYGHSGILIFKPRVVQSIGRYLQEYGEFLPVICKQAELVLYNVTRLIDGLDEEKSTIERFDDGRVMWIDKHIFHEERIKGVDVFKLSTKTSATYLSPRFVEIWNKHGLTGYNFVPVK